MTEEHVSRFEGPNLPRQGEQGAFVVVQDLGRVLEWWAARENLQLPHTSLIDTLGQVGLDFLQHTISPDIRIIPEALMSTSMDGCIERARVSQVTPVIIADDTYRTGGEMIHRLSVTRTVSESQTPLGYKPRPGFPEIEAQLEYVLSNSGGKPLQLVDDVAITGGTLTHIVDLLHERNIRVDQAFTCIATQAAIDDFWGRGITLTADYVLNSPADVICERDLYPGFGGLTIQNSRAQGESFPTAIPYLPFYMNREMLDRLFNAQVSPAKLDQMTLLFYNLSIGLLAQIETLSERRLRLEDLPRSPMHSQGFRGAIGALAKELNYHLGFVDYQQRNRTQNG